MGQVPFDLIIGRGRIATHLSHYLGLAGHPYSIQQWNRHESKEQLEGLLTSARAIFVCIKDDALADFFLNIKDKSKFVHFSGSQTFSEVFGAHPLMTFSTELYTKEVYEQIPFVLDQPCERFSHIFPTLKNNTYQIQPEQKALYHALCVLSGNFTTIMWSALAKEMKERLNLPSDVLNLYLTTTAKNTLKNHFAALTGPLARGDQKVIDTHLAILQSTPWQALYQDLIQTYERFKK